MEGEINYNYNCNYNISSF